MDIFNKFKPVVDLIFPTYCLICGCKIDREFLLCPVCNRNFLSSTGKVELNKEYPNFGKIPIKATSIYTGDMKKLIRKWKFEEEHGLTKIFSDLLVKIISKHLLDNPEKCKLLPVPSKLRGIKRRNLMVELAEIISEHTGIEVEKNFIFRKENYSTQLGKSRKDRFKYVKEKFICNDKNSGGNYIIIDDIITTGATVSYVKELCLNNKKNIAEIIIISARIKKE